MGQLWSGHLSGLPTAFCLRRNGHGVTWSTWSKVIRKYNPPFLRRQTCCFRILIPPSCQLQQWVPQQCKDKEREVARGGGDPWSQALCIAVVWIAALNAHSRCFGSIPLCPLAEGPERTGLHNATQLMHYSDSTHDKEVLSFSVAAEGISLSVSAPFVPTVSQR